MVGCESRYVCGIGEPGTHRNLRDLPWAMMGGNLQLAEVTHLGTTHSGRDQCVVVSARECLPHDWELRSAVLDTCDRDRT